ncbi:sideroflexin-5-like [Hydractinia symbiolongicarpus]|uniref:sideroflexin-5-like n=1 Tax=Hydractinia symbiolongicarpus TaxID=13093 RepID=UPI00254E525D|nr:sideroflexin-5-like [Hydractinia symbiolongicarpus]
MTYPPFSLDKQRYDQSTYFGRVQRCFSIVDPSTLFVSSKKLTDSMALLNDFNEGTLPAGVTDAQLWKARKIKEAIIHPDTGEKILMPFRMSGYVPFGTVSVIGMLIPGASVKQVIFWQWLNQTHNACVNYSNRNATKPTPTARFVMSYVGAVTSAVGIAVGISMLIRKTSLLSAGQKLLASRFVAYPATSAANVCNVYMMRQNELQEGVEVEDENGNVVGSSKIAASKAVYETAISRVLLPAPILIFPPLIMAWLEKTKTFRRKPRLNMPINAAVCTLAFGLALPFAIAMFPQKTKIEVSKLEAEISSKTSSGVVYFNKGL